MKTASGQAGEPSGNKNDDLLHAGSVDMSAGRDLLFPLQYVTEQRDILHGAPSEEVKE